MTADHRCHYEERFAHLEAELAEVNAKLESERERQNQMQMELIEKVTTVTVLLKQGQQQRKNNNKKIDDLEKKVDKLQNDFTDFVASQRSFRNTVIVGVPIAISIIVGIVFKFIS